MAILDFLNYANPTIIKKSVAGFYFKDPLLNEIMAKNKVIMSGGPYARFVRLKNRPSDPVEITATNMGTPLINVSISGECRADWAWYNMPLVFAHAERDRYTSKEEVARWVKDKTDACMIGFRTLVSTQLYVGTVYGKTGARILDSIGTLNGNVTDLQPTGITHGALRFQTPTAQAAASIPYLNVTRVEDTTQDENNWYNHFAQHGGIGVDFCDIVEQVKMEADTYAEGQGEISMGVMWTRNHSYMSRALRQYPGGGGVTAITYTVDDVAKGRMIPGVFMWGGIKWYSNRKMTDTALSQTQPAYLLNPDTIEFWVNAKKHFAVGKTIDLSTTTLQEADAAVVRLECQFAMTNPVSNACVSR